MNCPTDTCQIDPYPLVVAWDRQVGTGQIGANLDFCRGGDGCSVSYQRDGFTVNVGIMRSAVTRTLDYLLTVTVVTS